MFIVYFDKEDYPLHFKTWYRAIRTQFGCDIFISFIFATLGWLGNKSRSFKDID